MTDIRSARREDLQSLLDLQRSCYPPELHDDEETVAGLIPGALIAEFEGQVVGAAIVDGDLLYSIEVHPEYRRNGVGLVLMWVAVEKGVRWAYALPDGVGLLSALGWVETGETKEISGHLAKVMRRPENV